MLDRLLGAALTLLAVAVALYVAVRLIESIAATLLVMAAVVGGLFIVGSVVRLLWQRRRISRW